MTGALCLFPAQTPVVNAAIAPSPDDIRWAAEFLAAFHGSGGRIRDGSDRLRLHRATRITELARAYGRLTTAG